MTSRREQWIEEQSYMWAVAHNVPKEYFGDLQAMFRNAMAVADAHPLPLKTFERPPFPVEPMDDSDSLEQPSPMRVVDSSASDNTDDATQGLEYETLD